MAPDPGETLFLAEQPPLPPAPLLPASLTNGSIVPTAKPAPTLIKVFSASGCPPSHDVILAVGTTARGGWVHLPAFKALAKGDLDISHLCTARGTLNTILVCFVVKNTLPQPG